jgi:8-oxo-dGTP pyrophosphatase MutT (NUDIX family)
MTDTRTATLLDLLEGFVPANEVEASHVHELTRLLATTGEPFSRRHFDPGHVTASAFVIDPSSGRILLHHHRRLDRWLQMGGHLDDGEDVVSAALREAREESGLEDLHPFVELPFDIDVHVIPEARGEPRHLHFDVRFVVATGKPEEATITPEESLDLAWLELDDAERRMNAPESSRALRKIRALLRS